MDIFNNYIFELEDEIKTLWWSVSVVGIIRWAAAAFPPAPSFFVHKNVKLFLRRHVSWRLRDLNFIDLFFCYIEKLQINHLTDHMLEVTDPYQQPPWFRGRHMFLLWAVLTILSR